MMSYPNNHLCVQVYHTKAYAAKVSALRFYKVCVSAMF